jgi:hypothetical protein
MSVGEIFPEIFLIGISKSSNRLASSVISLIHYTQVEDHLYEVHPIHLILHIEDRQDDLHEDDEEGSFVDDGYDR